jgi:replicative DNA helicase
MQTETLELLHRAALDHASQGMEAATSVFTRCDVADFPTGVMQDLASTLVAMMNAGEVIEPMVVMTRCAEQSPALLKFFTVEVTGQRYATPSYVAVKVREHADRQRLAAALTRATQQVNGTLPTEDVVARLEQDLAVLQRPDDLDDATLTLEDVLSVPDEDARWIMRNMLRVNERLMFTGMEGGGKSTLLAQIALGAAMGVHTLSLDYEQHEPVRVLILDVENSLIQVRNNARKIYPTLAEMTGRSTAPLEWINQRYIDLSDPKDAARIIRLAKEKRPQLMFMGSVYKLASEGDKHEASFNAISRTVDRIRAETGAAVVLEAHTGHGFQNDRSKGSGMRPDGSSRWLRWPEMGYGMVPMGKQYPGVIELVPFRGMRDDSYIWPKGLRRGSLLPFDPIMPDRWEAQYAQH